MERATQARRRSSVEESATAGRRVSLWLNPFDVTDSLRDGFVPGPPEHSLSYSTLFVP